MRRLRPHLTYANVVATLCLFVVLGGTGYAATKINGKNLKNRSVTAKKIKRSTLTGTEVTDRSLRARDFRKGELPAGPQGPRGAAGAGLGPAEPWKPLAFATTWANYGAGHSPGTYRKDQLGRVHLRGLVTHNGGLPSNGELIATLPAGYRPTGELVFVAAAGELAGERRIHVEPDGELKWYDEAAPLAEQDYESLSQISFWTD